MHCGRARQCACAAVHTRDNGSVGGRAGGAITAAWFLAEFVGDTPEQFTAFIRAEIAKWAKAVKASGAKPE